MSNHPGWLNALLIGATAGLLLFTAVVAVRGEEPKRGYVQAVLNPAIAEAIDLTALQAIFAAGCKKDGLEPAMGMGRLEGTAFVSLIFSCEPSQKKAA